MIGQAIIEAYFDGFIDVAEGFSWKWLIVITIKAALLHMFHCFV